MRKLIEWLKERWRRLWWKRRLIGRWFYDQWAASARDIDVDVLWPRIKDQCCDLPTARLAMAFHARQDWAWQRLGEQGIYDRIEQLK